MNESYEDLRALYRKARRDEEPTRNDKRAVRLALVGAGSAAAFQTTTAAGKLLALMPGAGKVLTLGQVVLYATIGAGVGGGLAALGATVSNRTAADSAVAALPRYARAPHSLASMAPPTAQRAALEAAPTPSQQAPSEQPAARLPVGRAANQPLRENALPPTQGAKTADARFDAVTPVSAASVGSPPSLVDESRALAAVQSALGANDARRALQLLDAQDRTFAGGSLAQERVAARVLALCVAGDIGHARLLRERFLQTYPGSPLVRRINTACEK